MMYSTVHNLATPHILVSEEPDLFVFHAVLSRPSESLQKFVFGHLLEFDPFLVLVPHQFQKISCLSVFLVNHSTRSVSTSKSLEHKKVPTKHRHT